MGDGVFGNPITDSTLKGMPEFAENQELKPIDRARVALIVKNAEGKDGRALKYLEDLKGATSDPNQTLCLVYNATGSTVQYVGHNDWRGRLGTAPYPALIANGQWGAFLHRGFGDLGPMAAVVYRGKDGDGNDRDWMVAWNNPRDRQWVNRAYTEVRDKDSFVGNKWDDVHQQIVGLPGYVDTSTYNGGCKSFASTGNDIIAIYRAIFTLENVIDQ